MSSSGVSIQELIKKKEDGQALSEEEIKSFVTYVTNIQKEKGSNAQNDDKLSNQEEQIVCMLKAIHNNYLNDEETKHLTKAMKESGETLKWPSEWNGLLVDKHSTGGVGDKTSLVLAPVLAACGLKVPMISGKGLGHTGGTLDKLQAIENFEIDLSKDKMEKVLEDVGCCIVGQTNNLVPADKILYDLRNSSDTVDEKGLVTGSIISKKAAEAPNALVLDVKYGKGAFFKKLDDARELATKMVNAGNFNGIKTMAILTDMNSPLGYQIGNALEVAESIQCLHGNGPEDLTDLVKELGAQLLVSVDKVNNLEEAYRMIDTTLQNGTAIAKFAAMLKAQGVDETLALSLCEKGSDVLNILKQSEQTTPLPLKAKTTGYVTSIDALICGEVSRDLGANRKTREDSISYDVGLTLAVRVGDRIEKGSTWVTVHHKRDAQPDSKLITKLERAIEIKPDELSVTLYSRKGDLFNWMKQNDV